MASNPMDNRAATSVGPSGIKTISWFSSRLGINRPVFVPGHVHLSPLTCRSRSPTFFPAPSFIGKAWADLAGTHRHSKSFKAFNVTPKLEASLES